MFCMKTSASVNMVISPYVVDTELNFHDKENKSAFKKKTETTV